MVNPNGQRPGPISSAEPCERLARLGEPLAEPSELLVELVSRYHEALTEGNETVGDVETAGLDAGSQAEFELAKRALDRLARVRDELTVVYQPADSALFAAWSELAPLLGASTATPDSDQTDSADQPATAGPRTFGRFEIVRELGRGGLGVVFLAHDPVLNRQVALKIPRPEALLTPDLRQRFAREARAAARLTHPHLVSVYEVGEVGPICYIASAYCNGPNLASRLRAHGLLPARQAASLVAKLADAMHYAHSHGVLHRDLKPSNVLLEPKSGAPRANDGDDLEPTPKITDFGLAKLEDYSGDSTRTGFVLGTPAYMAPEQAQGRLHEIDARTDVFGLGAILFELLTGQPPCAGSSEADTLRRVLTDEPAFRGESLRALPADLRAITLKCLEKEPRRRYPSADELAADLRRFLAGQPTQARPLGAIGRALKWSRRRPTAAALLLVSSAAAVTVLSGSLYYSARNARLFSVAEKHRIDAEARKAEVEQQQESLRHYLYAADMPLAYKAFQRNNIEQMHEVLERHVPRGAQSDVRGFAWRYLDRLGHAERFILRGHEGEVFTVQYSRDGQLLASCGFDKTVRLWNAADGRLLTTLRAHTDEVNCLAFSPDGAWIASCDNAGQVCVWKVEQLSGGQPRGQQPTQVHALDGQVATVAISPDGTLVAATAGETVELLPLRADGERFKLDGFGSKITAVEFAPDSKSVFLSYGGTLSHWDLTTKTELSSGVVHDRSISAIALSHSGDRIAAVDHSGKVSVCDAETLQPVVQPRAQVGRVDAIAYSPDDRHLAIGGRDRLVELWDIEAGQVTRVLRGHTGWVWSADFSPDGKSLATASRDGTVRVWDLSITNPWQIARNEQSTYRSISISRDSRLLAAGDNIGNIQVWSLETGELHASWRAHWHPYGPQESAQATAIIHAVVFSPTRDELATSADDGVVRVWDSATGRLRCELVGGSCGALNFSADGRYLTVGAERKEATSRIWDLESRTCWPADFRLANTESVFVVGPGAAKIISKGGDAFECIRRHDGATIWAQTLPSDVAAYAAISSGGEFLAVGTGAVDRVVYLWNVSTGGYLGAFVGHGTAVTSIAFSPDARTLAGAGSEEGHIRLWDIYSRQELLTLECDASRIWQLAFSPDGTALVAVALTHDGKSALYVWRASAPTDMEKTPRKKRSLAQSLGPKSVEAEDSPARPIPDRRLAEAHYYFRHCALLDEPLRVQFGDSGLPIFEEQCRDGVVYHGAIRLFRQPRSIAHHQWPAAFDNADVRGQLRLVLNASAEFPDVPAVPLFPIEVNRIESPWRFLKLATDEIEVKFIPVAEIGPVDDIFVRFRAVHRWAKAHGYVGGVPNFADDVKRGHESYGVVLFKPGMGEEVWIPVAQRKP